MAKYEVTYSSWDGHYETTTIEADIAFTDDNGSLVLSNDNSDSLNVKAIFAKNMWITAKQV